MEAVIVPGCREDKECRAVNLEVINLNSCNWKVYFLGFLEKCAGNRRIVVKRIGKKQ